MSDSSLTEQLRTRLRALSPRQLNLTNESHLHVGHQEAGNGAHFRLHIVSDCFVGLSILARHRLIYDTVGALMEQGIHALSIAAFTFEEHSHRKDSRS
jgi:BolA protein